VISNLLFVSPGFKKSRAGAVLSATEMWWMAISPLTVHVQTQNKDVKSYTVGPALFCLDSFSVSYPVPADRARYRSDPVLPYRSEMVRETESTTIQSLPKFDILYNRRIQLSI